MPAQTHLSRRERGTLVRAIGRQAEGRRQAEGFAANDHSGRLLDKGMATTADRQTQRGSEGLRGSSGTAGDARPKFKD